jgi:hypothetical protein
MLFSAALAAMALPAQAQTMQNAMPGGGMGGVPVYNSWQSGWSHGQYDRHHVILGSVVSFSPYRITVQRMNGNQQTVDLKNGTVIRPIGLTPRPGMRVALIGYYSNGTFIVNRLVLRRHHAM